MFRPLIAFTLATAVVAGCQEGGPPPAAEPIEEIPLTFNVEGNPTTQFKVPAIHCSACCKGATEVLAEVPGVVDVYVSPASKRVIVAVDEATFNGGMAKEALESKFGAVMEVVAAESSANR